ncbi:hypothetical protein ACFYY1_19945 [Streptomyces sp. NPDC001890]|uniref:hypothetical protein n=1 Tax=Streptomyces sp. NPDC001890 TaxID=3364620 RepID=UPI0036924D4A
MENPAPTKPTPPEDPIRLDGWIAPAIATVAAVILSYAALMVVLFAFLGPGNCDDVRDGCSWGAEATRSVMGTAARSIPYVTPLGLLVTWMLPWRSRWTAARRRATAFAFLPHAVITASLPPLLVFGS